MRLALFLPVSASSFRFGLGFALLAGLLSAAVLGVASRLTQEYNEIYVNVYGLLGLIVLMFTLLLAALAYVRSQGSLDRLPELLTAWASASPFLVIVSVAALQVASYGGLRAPVLIAVVIWAIAIAQRGVLLVYPNASTRSRTVLASSFAVLSYSLWRIGLVPVLFFSYDTSAYEDEEFDWVDQEAVYYRQPELLDTELARIADDEKGVTDLYFIGFAGNGDESVFQSEVEYAADVVHQKYDAFTRTMVLANDTDNLDVRPLANTHNLYAAIRHVGEKMDVAEDILFLFLTSHGSRDGTIEVSLFPFEFAQLSAQDLRRELDDSGIQWRIIVVSACYSGSFIEHLQNDRTAVFTAASADKTSFGCSDQRELTYFGEAFFRDSLGNGESLVQSFERAVQIIDERESDEGISASSPQSFVGEEMAAKLLELDAAARRDTP